MLPVNVEVIYKLLSGFLFAVLLVPVSNVFA